jgi:hypothetical protein
LRNIQLSKLQNVGQLTISNNAALTSITIPHIGVVQSLILDGNTNLNSFAAGALRPNTLGTKLQITGNGSPYIEDLTPLLEGLTTTSPTLNITITQACCPSYSWFEQNSDTTTLTPPRMSYCVDCINVTSISPSTAPVTGSIPIVVQFTGMPMLKTLQFQFGDLS